MAWVREALTPRCSAWRQVGFERLPPSTENRRRNGLNKQIISYIRMYHLFCLQVISMSVQDVLFLRVCSSADSSVASIRVPWVSHKMVSLLNPNDAHFEPWTIYPGQLFPPGYIISLSSTLSYASLGVTITIVTVSIAGLIKSGYVILTAACRQYLSWSDEERPHYLNMEH